MRATNWPARIRQFWVRFSKNHAAVAGLVIVAALVAVSAGANLIRANDIFNINPGQTFESPSWSHPFGTDNLGRDMFSLFLYAGRVSFEVGFTAAAVSVLLGTLLGSIAGFYGGVVDDVIMRFTEMFLAIPILLLGLTILIIYGPGLSHVVFVIAVLSWPVTARLVRAEFLTLKEREFVEGLRAVGAPNHVIIFNEIMPNALIPVIINASLQVGAAITVEAGLSFLGLGDPSNPSWGYLLQQAQTFLTRAWWIATFPGIGLLLAILSLSLIGDGLNDALNPRLAEKG
ncbi:MAG: ABC transporter permease [Thaumarchaeota archaeon]|nr:ABC transporter permease [Nitrososphaerota archaeon]